MKILATIEYNTEFWIAVVAFSLLASILIVGGLILLTTYKGKDGVIGGISFIVVGMVFVAIAFDCYKEGPAVEYKVMINDFNVIHEQGYEITDQEGEIYTLKKKEY